MSQSTNLRRAERRRMARAAARHGVEEQPATTRRWPALNTFLLAALLLALAVVPASLAAPNPETLTRRWLPIELLAGGVL